MKIGVFVALLLSAVGLEFCFRRWHRKKFKADFTPKTKPRRWEDNYVEPNPFLTFSYRRNFVLSRPQRIRYKLHPDKYHSFRTPLRLNNLGHFGRDVAPRKPDGVKRIACLGSSTTANNIADEAGDHCYPEILQQLLDGRAGGGCAEVLNCGIGGWSTPDIFINFALNILPLSPDAVIFYHGMNDLQHYLADDFRPDYAHARRGLGEVLHRIRLAWRLPSIPFLHSYEWLKWKVLGTGNVRNDVLRLIVRSPVDYSRALPDLTPEREVLDNLILLCQGRGIPIVVASFAFYDHDGSEKLRKLAEGVRIENEMFRDLARERGCPFVDIAALIPKDDEHFVDEVHLSPRGMRLLAGAMAEALNPILR
jgi:lysophospholipase L1-like esterase